MVSLLFQKKLPNQNCFDFCLADRPSVKDIISCKVARNFLKQLRIVHEQIDERIQKETELKKTNLLKVLDSVRNVAEGMVHYLTVDYICREID